MVNTEQEGGALGTASLVVPFCLGVAIQGPTEDAIHHLARFNRVEALRAAVSAAPELVDLCDAQGNTALLVAAEAGSLEAVSFLLSVGANVDSLGVNNLTPLHLAEDPAIVRLLLESGAEPSHLCAFGQTPMWSAMSRGNVAVVREMKRFGVELDLCTAVALGDIAGVRRALDSPLVQDQVLASGIPAGFLTVDPILIAAKYGHLDVLSQLVDSGLSLGPEPRAAEALLLAATNDDSAMIDWLCKRGASPNGSETTFETPLSRACYMGGQRAAEALLKNGAQVDLLQQPHRIRPVAVATWHGYQDVVEVLLSWGAAAEAPTDPVPLGLLAALNSDPGMWEVLRSAGVQQDVFVASAFGDVEAIEWLFQNGEANGNAVDPVFGRSALTWAMQCGQTEAARLLLGWGMRPQRGLPTLSGEAWHPRLRNTGGPSLDDGIQVDSISLAVLHGHVEVAMEVAREYPSVELLSEALIHATSRDSEQLARLLLDLGADPDSGVGQPALFVAVQRSSPITPFLLSHGANPNALSIDDECILDWSVRQKATQTHLLVDAGAKPTLAYYCATEDVDSIRAYLESRSSQETEPWGSTPTILTIAARRSSADVIEALIAHGMPFEADSRHASMAAMEAAAEGSLATLQWLIQRGVSINVRDVRGRTLLHYASMSDRPMVVRWLITKGLSVDERDDLRASPLLLACKYGAVESASVLLSAGADIAATDSSGMTSLHYAAEGSDLDMIQFVLDAGVEVNRRDWFGRTALGWSERGPRFDRLRRRPDALTPSGVYLIEKGARY